MASFTRSQRNEWHFVWRFGERGRWLERDYMCFRIRGYRAAPFLFTSNSFIVDNFLQFAPFFSTAAVLFYLRCYFLHCVSCPVLPSWGESVSFVDASRITISAEQNTTFIWKNNHEKENHRNVKMFGLPVAAEERKVWINFIHNLTEKVVNSLKGNPAVCLRHWPENYPETQSTAPLTTYHHVFSTALLLMAIV